MPPSRVRKPRDLSGESRGAPRRVCAAHGRSCLLGARCCFPLQICRPPQSQIPARWGDASVPSAHALPSSSSSSSPGRSTLSRGWAGQGGGSPAPPLPKPGRDPRPHPPSPCALSTAHFPRTQTSGKARGSPFPLPEARFHNPLTALWPQVTWRLPHLPLRPPVSLSLACQPLPPGAVWISVCCP